MSLFEGYWKQILGADAPTEEALVIPEGYTECKGDNKCQRCQSGMWPFDKQHWFKSVNLLGKEHHQILTAEGIRARQPKPFMPSVLKGVDETEVDYKGAEDAAFDEMEGEHEEQRLRDLDTPLMPKPTDGSNR